MLQTLRNFISGHPDKIGFSFDEDVFLEGLKFSFKEEYPWKNRKKMRGFFEKLYAHKSVNSYQKIIEWKTIRQQERTHILYSWALILGLLSILLISGGLALMVLGHVLPAMILSGAGIGMLATDFLLRRTASSSQRSWKLITGLLKTLIAPHGQKHIKAA
jgi:hypothetical protein